MNKSNKILTLALIGMGLIALAIFIAIFANGSEIRTSEPQENNSISAVYCTAKGMEDRFYYSENVNTIENEIKITYDKNSIDKLYYSYDGVYRSYDVMKQDDGVFQAKYNNYMNENGQKPEELSVAYDEMNTKLHIGIYADNVSKLNEATAVFFFINKEDVNQFKKYSLEEVSKYYKNKGFSCNTVK